MKKVLSCICLVSLLFLLTACDPGIFQYDYDELKETVVRVEYIYYENPNAKRLDEFLVDKKDKLLPFNFDKMEIRGVLPNEKLDDFLKDLCQYEIMMHWIHSDSPKNECIRLIYSNGDFEIITNRENEYVGSFYSTGEVKRFIGDGISKKLFSKWFDVQS